MAAVWNNYYSNSDRKRAAVMTNAVRIRSTSLVIPAGQ